MYKEKNAPNYRAYVIASRLTELALKLLLGWTYRFRNSLKAIAQMVVPTSRVGLLLGSYGLST